MIGEAAEVERDRTLRADVCVVGAGPAGIAIAGELAAGPLEVVLLESGGTEGDAAAQDLCAGEQLGAPQWPLETTRLRLLGGTSNHWAGVCRPFDAIDLAERAWLPGSGWPLAPEELERHYPRAFELCGVSFENFAARARSARAGAPARLREQGIEVRLAVKAPGVRFGQTRRGLLAGSARIRCLLHATATELAPDPTQRRVERVHARTPGGRAFQVEARAFVLACGAIENARLLLLSSRSDPRGLGNARDLVGRYYMDHPAAKPFALLQLFGSDPPPISSADERATNPWITALALSPEVQAEGGLLNAAVYAFGFGTPEELAGLEGMGAGALDPDDASTLRFLQRLQGERAPARAALCWIESEQAPSPESRVRLGDALDALGQPRAVVDWRLTDTDRRSLVETARRLALALGRAGAGRVKLRPWLLEAAPDWWRHLFPGGWHAMGTTRMAADPGRGVVDPQCRVFGLENLYLAGSSVFPTGSYDAPTVKLLALALRLAAHLRRELAG